MNNPSPAGYPIEHSYPNWQIGDKVAIELDVEDAISMREALSIILGDQLQDLAHNGIATHRSQPLYYCYDLLRRLSAASLKH